MITVTLIRHGQKSTTLPDPELTAVGHAQAKLTGELLASWAVDRILVSPMRRTQETAAYIAQSLGLPIHTDQRLRERMDYQDYHDETFDAFVAEWIKATEDREYVPKWGDSSLATGERVEAVIRDCEVEHLNHVVFVTHGGAIADFLKNVFDIKLLERELADILLDKDFEIRECSITTIQKDGDHYQMKLCHDTAHLK